MDSNSRDTTIILFKKAIKAGCKNYDLYTKLFYCQEWNGDYLNAEKNISEAILIDSTKDPELYYSRGELNLKLKRLENAKTDFVKYVSFANARDPFSAYYRIGAVQYVLGDTVNSKINMAKAVKLNDGKELRSFEDFTKSWGAIK
jgi:tetratricopeptide (TPR) repeat protein